VRDRACNGSRSRSVPDRIFEMRQQEQGLFQIGNGNAIGIVANISRHHVINLHLGVVIDLWSCSSYEVPQHHGWEFQRSAT